MRENKRQNSHMKKPTTNTPEQKHPMLFSIFSEFTASEQTAAT
jgi:hypothetical protein